MEKKKRRKKEREKRRTGNTLQRTEREQRTGKTSGTATDGREKGKTEGETEKPAAGSIAAKNEVRRKPEEQAGCVGGIHISAFHLRFFGLLSSRCSGKRSRAWRLVLRCGREYHGRQSDGAAAATHSTRCHVLQNIYKYF